MVRIFFIMCGTYNPQISTDNYVCDDYIYFNKQDKRKANIRKGKNIKKTALVMLDYLIE